MIAHMCSDNRFELIRKYKEKLIRATNIESAHDEMKVLDSIFFRLWQMRWLDVLEKLEHKQIVELPCRPGDEVWIIDEVEPLQYVPAKRKVESITVCGGGNTIKIEGESFQRAWGIVAFATEEEAERGVKCLINM